MTCEEFEELSGAYALDAVTPAERQAAEAHLATCAKCTSLLRDLRGVVALLPLSVPQVKPSPTLKDRILAAIRQDSQETNHPPAQPQQPVPIGHARQPRRIPRIMIATAILMLALLGGLIAWNISLHAQLASLQGKKAPSNVTSYPIEGSTITSATGQLFYFAQQNITVLIIHGLPQLQGSHVYQGWLLHTKGDSIGSGIKDTTSIGVLNVRGGSASVSFAGNVSGYDATAISVEKGPFATPNAPKGSVVAIGSLKHAAKVSNNSGSFELTLLFSCLICSSFASIYKPSHKTRVFRG